MPEKRKPTWKQKHLTPNEPTMLEFDHTEPALTGTSEYGKWGLYNLKVTNQKVLTEEKEVLDGYSGEAVMFLNLGDKDGKIPKITQKLQKALQNDITKLMITKKAKESQRGGFYTDYEITDLDGNQVIV